MLHYIIQCIFFLPTTYLIFFLPATDLKFINYPPPDKTTKFAINLVLNFTLLSVSYVRGQSNKVQRVLHQVALSCLIPTTVHDVVVVTVAHAPLVRKLFSNYSICLKHIFYKISLHNHVTDLIQGNTVMIAGNLK